jgi:hypothetical protein
MSIGLAQPGSTSIQPTMIMRMMIPPMRPSLLGQLRRRCRGFRDDLHFGAVSQVDGRLENDLVTVLDAGIDFNLGALIGGDRDLARMGDAIFDDRDLHAVLIEDDCRRGHDQRRRLARDLQFNSAMAITANICHACTSGKARRGSM